jgi:hypothetical protein
VQWSVHKECIDGFRVQISGSSGEIQLFLFSQKCKLSTGAVQGVCRLIKTSELVSKVEWLKDCCRKELHRVNQFKYLEVFEEVPQGVRAEGIPRVLEDFPIQLRRDRVFEVDEEKLKRDSALKC